MKFTLKKIFMNSINGFLNTKARILFIVITLLVLVSGCEDLGVDTTKLPKAEWTILGKEKNQGFSSTTENNLLYSTSSANSKRKLSIKFGAYPTTNTPLKLVDYFKVPLAADEMIIGILDDDFFYLSTGTDNITITPQIRTLEGVSILFNDVRVQRHDNQFNPFEVTTVTGFITQK